MVLPVFLLFLKNKSGFLDIWKVFKEYGKYMEGGKISMSTRGYLTVIDGKKNILSSAFFPSDAYPSYLGLRVLEALKNNSVIELIDQINSDYPDEKIMLEGLRRDWYVKDKGNKNEYFHDYAYEFNCEKGELTVFHFGNKALTIHHDQIPLFHFIFEHEDKLYVPLCLDEKSMTLKKDFYREIRSMLKDGADEESFQKKIDQNADMLYMDQGRYVDSWKRDTGSFNKTVRTTKGDRLQFCVDDSFGKFYLYVQTPFIRAVASHQPYSSAKAAEKAIAEIIRTHPDDVFATVDFFKELKAYQETIEAIFACDDQALDERADKASAVRADMLGRLNEIKSSHRIWGDRDHLYDREIKNIVFRHYRRAKERQDKMEIKTDLSSSLADAKTRQGVHVSGHEATSHISVER